ncbi:MAG: hypothetical protein Q8O67_01705 [Deltaproteobacteria bacterium]|nr:hypothetical protein [Deltaproteobacteria bacterium]
MPVVKRILPVSLLLLAVACEPLTCQNRVDGLVTRVDDIPDVPPKCQGANAQFVGDVDITNQQQLDTLLGCTTVQGSILIHDSSDITDVGALVTLQSINNGYFLAFNNAALTDIQLPALISIDDGFAAIENPELLTVNLPALVSLEGDLTMRNNPKQTQIAVPNVEIIKTAVIIIDGVAKNVSFGNLILGDLPALTSLDGSFETLEIIEGAFEVYNTGLTNFVGMENLEKILNQGGAQQPRTVFRVDKLNPGLAVGIDFDDEFNIVPAGNPNLVNFAGLESLDLIAGDVFVGFNPELVNFTGLDDIKEVGNLAANVKNNLFVVENSKLTDFLGLEGDNDNDGDNDGFASVNGSAFIGLFFDRFGKPIAGGNDALIDLDGMQSLTTITGDLVLAFSPAMENLEGLDIFTTLGGDLTFLGTNLDDHKGALLLTTIGGDLNFGQLLREDGQPFDPAEDEDEKKLTDVFDVGTIVPTAVKFDPALGQNGFDSLTTINGNLILAFSDINDLQLSDPDGAANDNVGAANLTTVGGSLILYGNAAPDNLEGIETLNALGGLVVNFAIDAFGDLQPFENNGFNDFAALDVDLGIGGLIIGFDDDLDGAAFATLRNFVSIDGDVVLASVDNDNNRGPANLDELNVTEIGGDLVLCAIKNGDDAPLQADLDNLTALNINATTSVVGDVIIAFCSSLTNTTMNVQSIGGSFELTGLPVIEDINGLNTLVNVGELLVHDLPLLENINMPALANVTANLEIVNNPALVDFAFNLNQIGGTLRLVDLGDLTDIDGLQGLNIVGGDLEILDCANVNNTAGLNQLDDVDGKLTLRRLNSISNDNGEEGGAGGGANDLTFNQLVAVGSIEVTQMNDIQDLAGLENLAVVDDTISINANPNLETLFGLQGLVRIGRKLTISDNPLLTTAFFDDDNLDRVVDFDDDDGVANEATDPDGVDEAGLVSEGRTGLLLSIGDPLAQEADELGGQRGIIELRNNPLLDEADFLLGVRDGLQDVYEGSTLTCGNEGTIDLIDEEAKEFAFAACADAQDGVIDVFTDPDAVAGEGEGEAP